MWSSTPSIASGLDSNTFALLSFPDSGPPGDRTDPTLHPLSFSPPSWRRTSMTGTVTRGRSGWLKLYEHPVGPFWRRPRTLRTDSSPVSPRCYWYCRCITVTTCVVGEDSRTVFGPWPGNEEETHSGLGYCGNATRSRLAKRGNEENGPLVGKGRRQPKEDWGFVSQRELKKFLRKDWGSLGSTPREEKGRSRVDTTKICVLRFSSTLRNWTVLGSRV